MSGRPLIAASELEMLLNSNFHAADRRAESFDMAGPWPRLETFISAPLAIDNVGTSGWPTSPPPSAVVALAALVIDQSGQVR